MDRLTKEQRHRNMAAIHGRDTKPEMIVRKFLFSRGFRYRLNHPRLPGHPDLVCAIQNYYFRKRLFLAWSRRMQILCSTKDKC